MNIFILWHCFIDSSHGGVGRLGRHSTQLKENHLPPHPTLKNDLLVHTHPSIVINTVKLFRVQGLTIPVLHHKPCYLNAPFFSDEAGDMPWFSFGLETHIHFWTDKARDHSSLPSLPSLPTTHLPESSSLTHFHQHFMQQSSSKSTWPTCNKQVLKQQHYSLYK